MGVILHNANWDLKTILHHEDRAIAAARLSMHPEAKKQLAACLLNKARTLMSEEMDQKQVRKLIQEAEPIVYRYTESRDYERYQFVCNAAMCFAMDGDLDGAQAALDAADAIVFASPDSDLSVAEHLIEEAAPIRIAMDQFNLAEDAVLRAIALCEKHSYMLRGIRFSTAMQSMETVTPLSYPSFTHSVDIVLTADSFHRTFLYRLTGSPPGGSI